MYSGLFRNSEEEIGFFQRFELLVEQFGIENIVVCLPLKWASEFRGYDDLVQIAFCTASEVKVIARQDFVVIEDTTAIFENPSVEYAAACSPISPERSQVVSAQPGEMLTAA